MKLKIVKDLFDLIERKNILFKVNINKEDLEKFHFEMVKQFSGADTNVGTFHIYEIDGMYEDGDIISLEHFKDIIKFLYN